MLPIVGGVGISTDASFFTYLARRRATFKIKQFSLSYPFCHVLFTFPCGGLLKGRLRYLF